MQFRLGVKSGGDGRAAEQKLAGRAAKAEEQVGVTIVTKIASGNLAGNDQGAGGKGRIEAAGEAETDQSVHIGRESHRGTGGTPRGAAAHTDFHRQAPEQPRFGGQSGYEAEH